MKSRAQLIDIVKSHRLFWIICGGVLLLNILFYLFFVASESHETAALQSRFQAERKKVSDQRKQQARIEQYKALQAAWQDFEAGLPGKIHFPERIQQLKEILNRHRLNAEDLAFRAEPLNDTRLVRFTTTFKTAGPYEALKQFIGELQTLDGLFCIHTFELRRPETGHPVQMTMELSAYFINDTSANDALIPNGPEARQTR